MVQAGRTVYLTKSLANSNQRLHGYDNFQIENKYSNWSVYSWEDGTLSIFNRLIRLL